MGQLDKLEEELYGQGEEDLTKRMRKRILFPGTLRHPKTFWQEETPHEHPQEEPPSTIRKTAMKILFGALAVLGIAGISAFVFVYLGTRGSEAEVLIHDRGPIEAGELVTIPITFKNTSQTVLKEAELTIILPSGSILVDERGEAPVPPRIIQKINDVEPGGEGTIEITTRFFGKEREEKPVQAILVYRPENVRARFSARANKSFFISRVPLALTWELPAALTQGQDVTIKVHYSSNAANPFENISLRLEYPPGFTFVSADPAPEIGENIWGIGTVSPDKGEMITLYGTIAGAEGEVKAFRGELGIFNRLTKEWRSYAESSQETKIAVTPLSVQTVMKGARAGNISPGERPEFKISYKNNTSVALKNITLRAFITGDIVDFSTVELNNGAVFDGVTHSLVWGPGGTSELREIAPGAGGEFNFSLQTRPKPMIRTSSDKNLTLRVRAVIESAETPRELAGTKLASEDAVEFKVRTKVIFTGKSLYRLSPILNSGPLPPRVGAPTTYTISFEIKNFSSDLHNVEIHAPLSANVEWQGITYPSDAGFVFVPGSHEVRWFIGTVPAGTGVLSPSLTAAFQVRVRPSEADRGRALVLVNSPEIVGKDIFTGELIDEKIDDLSTELKSDPDTRENDWRVVP